jgi:hypothetical protein
MVAMNGARAPAYGYGLLAGADRVSADTSVGRKEHIVAGGFRCRPQLAVPKEYPSHASVLPPTA